jgi:hypothetical protein
MSAADGMLRVEGRDDGIGGADPRGHGLVGLGDRATRSEGGLTSRARRGAVRVLQRHCRFRMRPPRLEGRRAPGFTSQHYCTCRT